MKRFAFLALLVLISLQVFSYTSLRVGDPRSSWRTYTGTIEEAAISIKPQGAFIEYGLYLTFSAKGTNVSQNTDTLEVTLNFDLPEGAIVTDSWLWIDGEIIKAKIMDKWTASSIYEGIVKRRRDPSILTKESSTSYRLQIFPMVGDSSRRVKVSYLVPASMGDNSISAALPVQILNASANYVDKLKLYVWNSSTWNHFQIPEQENVIVQEVEDPGLGNHEIITIPRSGSWKALDARYEGSINNGIYVSQYREAGEGYYQFTLMPDQLLKNDVKNNVAVLVDFDASNTSFSREDILASLKDKLKNRLQETDHFNLFVSGLSIKKYNDDWVSATDDNIDKAFQQLQDKLSSYSNLGSLLAEGIEFVSSKDLEAKIILVASSDAYGDVTTGNTFVNDVMELMDEKIPIFIADFQTTSWSYNWINGRRYYGNEYFYSNLSRFTLGALNSYRESYSLSKLMDETFKNISGAITSFDLYTSVKSGICYGRYNLSSLNGMVYLNQPIQQVGKFKGDLPLMIEVTGEYNNEFISKQYEIDQGNIVDSDSALKKIWAGQYINSLESGKHTNTVIDNIIFQSINYRVLSYYTSFLCLEKEEYICYDCLDETKSTDLEIIGFNDSISVYPNPFVSDLTVKLKFGANEIVNSLKIVDVKGRTVHSFKQMSGNFETKELKWNGLMLDGNSVVAGVYLLICETNRSRYVQKLIKQ